VPDYDTIQRRRNIIVGAFVLVALGSLGWLVFKFGDLPTVVGRWTSYQVYVQFASAPGVDRNTPVQLGGYQIGRVTDVMAPQALEDQKTGLTYLQSKVIIAIDKKYATIPRNVDIKLMKRGFGSSYIELEIDPTRPLVPKDPNRPETAYLQNGMLLQGSVGMVSEFFPEESQQKLEELVSKLCILIGNANDIFGDKQNKENIRAALANLTEVTAQARETLEEIEKLSATGRGTIKNADEKLTQIANAALESGEELNAAVREFRMTIEKLNEGKGTAGRLLNNGQLYENLLDSAEELRLALEEFKKVMQKTNKKGGIKFSIF